MRYLHWQVSCTYAIFSSLDTEHDMILTKNSQWGFWGTISRSSYRTDWLPGRAWELAMTAITGATRCTERAAREYLDSSMGRHFADAVNDRLAAGTVLPVAINAAVADFVEMPYPNFPRRR
jgi:hypothetical protein